jgi:hypothetical protein
MKRNYQPRFTSAEALVPGIVVDIRDLELMEEQGDAVIILYFEEELARNSTYEKDMTDYAAFPEHERPFIPVSAFLSFQREMNPVFDEALASVPLEVTIVSCGRYKDHSLITALLPFLDEVDFT